MPLRWLKAVLRPAEPEFTTCVGQSNQMLDSHQLTGENDGQAGRVALLHHPDLFDSQD